MCLDIFVCEVGEVFYIGSNVMEDFMVIWCYLLIVFECLFIFGEYLYCEVYDIGECYGKDIFLLIDCFGMGWVFVVFVLKSCIDGWFESLGLCGVIDCVI